jgi:hypothetical protein
MSRHIGAELPFCAAWNPKRGKIFSVTLRLLHANRQTNTEVNVRIFALFDVSALKILFHNTGMSSRSVVPKACSAGPKGSATSSQGIHEYVSVTGTLKFTYFLSKGIMFVKDNRGTSLIGDVFISYVH